MHALVPVDNRSASWNALEFAAERAEVVDGELHVVHVATNQSSPETVKETALDILRDYDVDYSVDIFGMEQNPQPASEVADQITGLFDDSYSEVIVGNGVDESLRTALNGSVSQNLIEQQDAPVMLVP